MSLPFISSTEAHKDKLPCDKRHGLGDRSQRHLQCLPAQVVDRFNRVGVLPRNYSGLLATCGGSLIFVVAMQPAAASPQQK